ncbi:gamma-glutamyltransferase [Neorhizobium petrolearium]|uniref:Glutathione hydrolase proenzyme n=1 Tax=Neorhizobium petrolearium TaxID=515361 RepID=A0ABY8MAN6_9HYPH|nr:gamma-glutamyltransferase [Neorhizobium petrolearium]MCC2614048.1 gamma-glutamyltransferase [Neorhizobium petrolearium]WGI71567.1 gamma-glutamyltransferase [Neorhizobium petrolearium]
MRDFELPGRSLAVGRNAMAATSQPLATLAAIDILRSGGNAIDAAVAACAVQCVVEAGSTGIGGDCFALLSLGGTDKIIAYNGSGRAPAAATVEHLRSLGITSLTRTSPHTITVPGAVDAWTRLVADHGRMKMADILSPAIKLARDGYALPPRSAYDLAAQEEMLKGDPTASRTFLVDGKAPPAGSIRYQRELADTLEAIGREGRDAFYRGPIAEDLVRYLNSIGGLHTLEDFATAKGEYVTPIKTTFRGHEIHECPPNGQGIIALMILKILSHFPGKGDPLSPERLHIEVEATRLAYAARNRFLADPAKVDVPVDYLLSDALAKELAGMIDPTKAITDLPKFDEVPHRDTIYLSVVDSDRNVVSFINSIFFVYGSGRMDPNHGVMFHNRGFSFSLDPNHPNAVAPGKRPMHTIIPGMVTKNGRAVMPFGVMGGQYQAMGHAHFLSKVFDYGMDLQSAIDLPRLFPLPGTNQVEMEHRLRDTIGRDFERRGFQVKAPESPMGGAQAIWIDWETGVLRGGSDPRKDGMALGI